MTIAEMTKEELVYLQILEQQGMLIMKWNTRLASCLPCRLKWQWKKYQLILISQKHINKKYKKTVLEKQSEPFYF